jgi:hypothetical protein
LAGWLPSRTQITRNVGEDVGKKEPSYTNWWECKLVQPQWKTVWRILKKLKIELELLYNLATLLLEIYPKKYKKVIIKALAHPFYCSIIHSC